MWDEIKNIKSGKKELREFGLTIGIILVILGGIAAWRGKPVYPYFLSFGIAFIAAGIIMPAALRFPQVAWMTIAVIVGFFMNRLILSILFYTVITPIGIIMRILGKDVLDQRIDKSAPSYWKKRETTTKTKESYQNQY
ncbi:MAG: SxtJ family membrane protein [Candidatus Omnitrophota bacterium]